MLYYGQIDLFCVKPTCAVIILTMENHDKCMCTNCDEERIIACEFRVILPSHIDFYTFIKIV